MAIQFINSAISTNGDTNGASTPATSFVGANLLVAALSRYIAGTVSTFTDGNGNSYTARTEDSVSGDVAIRLYDCFNPTGDLSALQISTTGTFMFATIGVFGFSGAITSPFDTDTVGHLSTSSSIPSSGVTPAEANEVFVAAASLGGDVTSPSIDSSFITPMLYEDYTSGGHQGLVMSYKIQTGGASAETPTISWTTAQNVAMTLGAYKHDPAIGAATVNLRTVRSNLIYR